MSEVTAQEQSTEGSVAADEGNLKRSLQMKMFSSKKIQGRVIAEEKSIALGQVIGTIFAIKEKVGTLPNGETKVSLLAFGDFEAVNYETGEVFQSTAAYLPGYYLETAAEMLKASNSGALLIAIEIVLVPTGKNIPVAYEVRNLVRRRPNSPLNMLKAELAATNRLRLPKPTEGPVALLEGEIIESRPLLDEERAAEAAAAVGPTTETTAASASAGVKSGVVFRLKRATPDT